MGKYTVRDRRAAALFQAFSETEKAVATAYGVRCSIRELTRNGNEVWRSTWSLNSDRTPPEGGWDWPVVRENAARTTDEFVVAIWHGNSTLCGVALLKLGGSAVRLEALEGNPDVNHPLKKYVIPVVLDLAVRFAQKVDRPEVWLIGPAQGLVQLYERVYEFALVEPRGQRRYCRKEVAA